MKERLDTSRLVVRALRQVPAVRGPRSPITAGWDGEPSPLWRKRLARHVRDCPGCLPERQRDGPGRAAAHRPGAGAGAGRRCRRRACCPAAVAWAMPPGAGPGTQARAAVRRGARGARHASAARHARLRAQGGGRRPAQADRGVVAVATCAAGGTVRGGHVTGAPRRAAATSALPDHPLPLAPPRPHRHAAAAQPTPQAEPKPSHADARRRPTVTSQRKGVSTWNFPGVTQALAESGASWYYNWARDPERHHRPGERELRPDDLGRGRASPPRPWRRSSRRGHVLLGFNEPDLGSQSNMTSQQALEPVAEADGHGHDPGQPRGGVRRGHAGQLARPVHAGRQGARLPGQLHHRALVRRQLRHRRPPSGAAELPAGHLRPVPPADLADRVRPHELRGRRRRSRREAQQAAFLTAASSMLDGLPYVQRYAWFALPVSAEAGRPACSTRGRLPPRSAAPSRPPGSRNSGRSSWSAGLSSLVEFPSPGIVRRRELPSGPGRRGRRPGATRRGG